VDWWKAGGWEPVGAFQILIAFGAGAGFASLVCVWLTPEPKMDRPERPTRLAESIALPLRERRFRWFVLLHSSYEGATGFCGGFFHLFMLTFLGMGYRWIAATDVVSQLVSLAGAPLWGRLADRWGTKRMLTLGLVVKAVFPLLWLGLLPQWWYMVFAVVLLRAFNSATEIGWVNLALDLAPGRDRAAYISVDRSAANLVGAFSPFVAGMVAGAIGGRVWQVGAVPMTALHVLIVVSGLLRLALLVWLRKVEEPARPGPIEVVGNENLHHDGSGRD
jgi:MFS family permease